MVSIPAAARAPPSPPSFFIFLLLISSFKALLFFPSPLLILTDEFAEICDVDIEKENVATYGFAKGGLHRGVQAK